MSLPAFRASLLPVFFTAFPTCFQGALAFRASRLPVFFHDFDYLTNVNGYNFTVVVLRKSKLADKINYAASPLNFQHALNCSSSKLRCQLNVETC